MRRLIAAVTLAAAVAASGAAQTDLDAFMARVLARRDENWKKLEQYILDERETLQVSGPGGVPLYGFERHYIWYPRGGRFVRSPLTADGAAIGENERRRYEDAWLEREARGTQEPGFVSAAYFLRFRFDPGHYALVGREMVEGRDALRIEYYPARMFAEGRTRPNRELRQRDEDVTRKMNKTTLVTLWVLPDAHQIVKYELTNIDMDFLPAPSLFRFEGGDAQMEMGEAFPGIWLPRSVRIAFELTLATGEVTAQYAADYHDYRLASVDVEVR